MPVAGVREHIEGQTEDPSPLADTACGGDLHNRFCSLGEFLGGHRCVEMGHLAVETADTDNLPLALRDLTGYGAGACGRKVVGSNPRVS